MRCFRRPNKSHYVGVVLQVVLSCSFVLSAAIVVLYSTPCCHAAMLEVIEVIEVRDQFFYALFRYKGVYLAVYKEI